MIGNILGIQNNLKIHGSALAPWPRSSANKVQPNLFCFLEIFKAPKFCMGFLGGLIFGPGIFLGFDFRPHSIIPATCNPPSCDHFSRHGA